jgi:hypothetical protein
MATRTILVNGEPWTVTPSGRVTQFVRDEFGVRFTRGTGEGAEHRIARFAPLGTRVPELALAELTEAQLAELFHRSQPAWTSPELGYGR